MTFKARWIDFLYRMATGRRWARKVFTPIGAIFFGLLLSLFVVTALLLRTGVLLESVSLLFIFTPLFILLSVWELKTIEEPELVKRLGRDYAEYRKRPPMFLPKIRTKQDRRR